MQELNALLARLENSVDGLVGEARRRDEFHAYRSEREFASVLVGLASFGGTDSNQGLAWVPLTAAQAEGLLARTLAGELTTGLYEYLTPSESVAAARNFVELVGVDAAYFSNVSCASEGGAGYSFSLDRGSTLDAGMVGVGVDCVAGVWIFEDD